ncbi:gas vesicle protein GVPa [Isosphaera pallida ATCC 43644]|uniref:Gas vesicle protein GVPa n=2 Tax=Isosphaera pallida TaxID=128 RepID=E8R1T2_ISOPI|nr:gas vesicle protein GVPa [Isosphaera pallida ATCC 43644]
MIVCSSSTPERIGPPMNLPPPHHAPWCYDSPDLETLPLDPAERIALCEVLDRVLNKGVVIHGEITISVAGVDLVYLGLNLLLTSVETAQSWKFRGMIE